MNIKKLVFILMISSTYLYLLVSSVFVSFILFIFLKIKPNKSNINDKLLLKNLLEGFDLEIPEELKRLDSSTTDPQKF